jgi:hypothetical protein
LGSLNVKFADYEWTPAETPAQTAQPAKPTRSETIFICTDPVTGEKVEAGEFFKRYTEKLLADPQRLAKIQRKREEKAARRQAREERLAERRRRRKAA